MCFAGPELVFLKNANVLVTQLQKKEIAIDNNLNKFLTNKRQNLEASRLDHNGLDTGEKPVIR